MTGRTPQAMTKAEAIQTLCRHAAGTDDAEYLRAVCIGVKAIARDVVHKRRVKAAKWDRQTVGPSDPQTAKEAAHA